MGEQLTTIKHIDVGVHFDYLRRGVSELTLNAKSRQRLDRCSRRIAVLSENPNAVLFLFSTYVAEVDGQSFKRHPQATNDEAYLEDEERIKNYQAIMGERFFLFEGFDKAKAPRLNSLFQERGLTYDPAETTMTAYGEWQEWCVKTIADHLGGELGIRAYRRYIDPTLSASFNSHLNLGIDPFTQQPLHPQNLPPKTIQS